MAIEEAYVVLAVAQEVGRAASVIAAMPFATLQGAHEAIAILRKYNGVHAHVICDFDDPSPSALAEPEPLETE